MAYKYFVHVEGYHGDQPNKSEAEEIQSEYADPEYAAKEYVEVEHGGMDCPAETDISIWDDKGSMTRWNITAEPDIRFHSSQIT